MRRSLFAVLLVALAMAVPPANAKPIASAAGFKSCVLPHNTFFTSIKVRGAGCGKARFVLTHSECQNAACSRFGYGSWSCGVKGDIAFRTTRCKSGRKRIVATASGD
jgi:hypothetical protein